MADFKFKDFMSIGFDDNDSFSNTQLDMLPLAMSYVPMQKFRNLFNEEEALKRGTLFCELEKPFYGKFTGAMK